MKLAIVLFGLLSLCRVHAQETIGAFVGSLDETSQELIQTAGGEFEDLVHVPYEIKSSEESMQVQINDSTHDDPRRGEFLLMLGAGIGLINTYGLQASVLRRNSNGRLTWFVQAKGTTFRPLSAPSTLNVGVGLFPFKKPTIGLSLNLTKPTYVPYVAVTPEVSANAFFGKDRQLRVYTSLAASYYPTVRNYKGKSGSFIPELEFGVALRLKKVSK